jgi:hypothetical protein
MARKKKDPYDTMVERILPELVRRFRSKSSDYGEVFRDLGIAGQYSDMHRKMHKLKRAMWDGEELKGEQPEEILSDLLGNILISIYLLREEARENAKELPGVRSGDRPKDQERSVQDVREAEGAESLQLPGEVNRAGATGPSRETQGEDRVPAQR